MKNKKFKQMLSLILSVFLIISILPMSVFGSSSDLPVMEAYNAASSGDYHKYYNKVVTVTFLDAIDNAALNDEETIDYWDVSADNDGSVVAWMIRNIEESELANADRYDVFIAGNGGIKANADSSCIFYCFSVLKEINGIENFHTESATTFFRLFEKCSSLKSIDLSSMNTSSLVDLGYLFSDCSSLINVDFTGWNTENVTSMRNMFNNCINIPVIDLSSFNTKNVTTMERLFYRCENLTKVYIGDNWNTDAVTNSTAMFNCCYLIDGMIKYDAYGKNDKTYADTDHYLTDESEKPQPEIKKYKVTYVIDGITPDGVVIYPEAEYDEGTNVVINPDYHVEGYEFSGWSSTDADITSGEFVIDKDVTIIGSFCKLYNIVYKYEGYVPDNAPDLYTYRMKAGEYVLVDSIPFVEGYVFSGWNSSDISPVDGRFIMPECDVVFVGSFKKPVESVEINGDSLTLDIDSEITINVTVKPEDATIKDLIYSSSDESVAVVDKFGKITAVGEGNAIITVVSRDNPDITDSIDVTVKIPVTEIIVDNKDYTLNTGDTVKIDVSVDENATNKELIFISSDNKIVNVDANGNITAIGEGTATVTVISKDNPSVSEQISIVVKNPVNDIIAAEDFIINIGEEKNVDASVNSDATNKNLIYESDNPDIAKVDSDGNVIAVGEGTATITIVSEDDPTIRETVTVTVKIPVNGITATDDFTLNIGDEKNVDAKVNDDATNKSLIYISANPNVATVDSEGNVTAIGEGTSVITIISQDNPMIKESVLVTVKIPVDDIIIPDDEITVNVGDSKDLSVVVSPDDATDKEVVYKSSDENIVIVDENGKITAVGEGTAIITVISKDNPEAKDTVKITVKIPVEDVEIPEDEITVNVGDSKDLSVAVTPDDATDKEVIYETSDKNVVIVDENGKITAVGEGTAIIKVYSKEDSSKFDTITVIVIEPVDPDEPVEPDEPDEPDDPDDPDDPSYVITAPDRIVVSVGQIKNLGAGVTPAGNVSITYKSSDKSIFTVDSEGNIKGIKAGNAKVTLSLPDGAQKTVIVIITDIPEIPQIHHICFGKTDGIGWYEVSVNGGDFKPQGPNSTLEVEDGSVIVVRVQDMWIDDDFTFYVNGKKVEKDVDNCITLTVDGYMLIGALSMDMDVPDVEESLSLLEKILNFIKALFSWIFGK